MVGLTEVGKLCVRSESCAHSPPWPWPSTSLVVHQCPSSSLPACCSPIPCYQQDTGTRCGVIAPGLAKPQNAVSSHPRPDPLERAARFNELFEFVSSRVRNLPTVGGGHAETGRKSRLVAIGSHYLGLNMDVRGKSRPVRWTPDIR